MAGKYYYSIFLFILAYCQGEILFCQSADSCQSIEYSVDFTEDYTNRRWKVLLFPVDSSGTRIGDEYVRIVSGKQSGISYVEVQAFGRNGQIVPKPDLPHDSDFRRLEFDHRYSVPYDRHCGKVRILINRYSGYIHTYVNVEKQVFGEKGNGWLEMSPIAFLADKYDKFEVETNYPAEITLNRYHRDSLPISDFCLENRTYVWSGFPGDAIVIRFPDIGGMSCPDYVFWKSANYVPLWVYSDELMFSYEFVETWSDTVPGCFEPMSDRMTVQSSVEVLEDNDVRKVVLWRYGLFNPDYAVPDPGMDSFPEVEEIYTIYPNAVIVRDIKYYPDLSTSHRSRHELSEMIVVSGSNTTPVSHIGAPALSVGNLSGDKYELLPSRKFSAAIVSEWREMIYKVNLKSGLKPFCSFVYRDENRCFSPLRVTPEFTWHKTSYRMSHWPVSRIPYSSYDKSFSRGMKVPSHTSLIGIEANDGIDWEYDYDKSADGRIFRNYLSLNGLYQNPNFADNCTSNWTNPAVIDSVRGGKYDGFDYRTFAHGFTASENDMLEFSMKSESDICWMVISIRNIKPEIFAEKVYVNGAEAEFRSDRTGDVLLMYIEMRPSTTLDVKVCYKKGQ